MDTNETDALIKLLSDPDSSVFEAVKTKLLSLGKQVLPQLKAAKTISNDKILLEQSSKIISEVEFKHSFGMFENWLKNDSHNLFDASFWIAKYVFPEIEYDNILLKIEKIRQDAWLQMNDNLTPLERIKVLNHIIYNIHKFKRNNEDFYAPENSCINTVLETKKTNPVSIAILYLIIARKLNLPMYGVNLPQNFILAYIESADRDSSRQDLENQVISFYVNPYQDGAVLTKREIDVFLKQQRLKPIPQFYNPCEDKIAIQRLLLHLFIAFKRNKEYQKHKDIQKFINIFKNRLPGYNM